MLIDDGRLVRDETSGAWVATGDLAGVHVPPTISALLSARLDRLSDQERAVVEAASVAGNAFHRGAVVALLPDTAMPDLDIHLRSLVRKELITPERSILHRAFAPDRTSCDPVGLARALIDAAASDQVRSVVALPG